MIRTGNHIFRFGRLYHQWLVDSFCTMETSRLDYHRQYQPQLRSHTYQGLTDQIRAGDANFEELGNRVILPATFIGSPRDQFQQYQDAMAIVRKYGKPDLFVTYTCNPSWTDFRASEHLIAPIWLLEFLIFVATLS
jgi:hypothetical protein